METIELKSLQHNLVKQAVSIRKNRSSREEHDSVLVMGAKPIIEQGRAKTVFLQKGFVFPPSLKADLCIIVSPEIMEKITGQHNPEGIAAEIALPKQKIPAGKRLLALDGISDPGNMGTMFRTALALQFEGIFLLNHCVDPFNEKVVASAKGAQFHLPFIEISQADFLSHAKGYSIYGAELYGTPLSEVKFSSPLILVVGNESHGINETLSSVCSHITIPMSTHMESLNAAIAAGIIMWSIHERL